MSIGGPWDAHGYSMPLSGEAHACNCVGPGPGETLCPCMKRAELRALDMEVARLIKLWGGKPRVRVKAGREVVA